MAHVDTTPTGEIERGARNGDPILEELRASDGPDQELRRIQYELGKDPVVNALRSSELFD